MFDPVNRMIENAMQGCQLSQSVIDEYVFYMRLLNVRAFNFLLNSSSFLLFYFGSNHRFSIIRLHWRAQFGKNARLCAVIFVYCLH